LSCIVFLCALLSKTVSCTLPAALVLLLCWKRAAFPWRDLLALAPLFALGLALGLYTAHLEVHQVGAAGEEWNLSALQRFLLAGRVICFYAGKLIWPAPLIFFYPRWNIDLQSLWQYLYPLSVIVVIVALWLGRKRLGTGPLVAVLFFIGTLFPALGFFNIYPMRFSFVADHFQYLACPGLLALFGAVGTLMGQRLPADRAWLAPVMSGLVVLILGSLTFERVGVYSDRKTLWEDTLAKNPQSDAAHGNLALVLADERNGEKGQQRLREAERHLREALRLSPRSWNYYYDLAVIYGYQGKYEQAIRSVDQALALNPKSGYAVGQRGYFLLCQKRVPEAEAWLTRAIQLRPDWSLARYNLGLAYLKQGKADAAAAEFRQVETLDPTHAAAAHSLGHALEETGHCDEAAHAYERAVNLQPENALFRISLGVALARQNNLSAARAQFQEASKDPDWPPAFIATARILATHPEARFRNGSVAVELAHSACKATNFSIPWFLAVLAAAQAEMGRYDQATHTARQAMDLAAKMGQEKIVQRIKAQLEDYSRNKPYREPPA
jgi:Tfp pilus assembly protein PilF